jgi:hypothetical protein
MKTLSEALNFISDFVPQPSENGELLYPILDVGLEREEIYQKTRILPYELPEEVYEMYQWSNGAKLKNLPCPERNSIHADFQPIDIFLSLDAAIQIAIDWNNEYFPLFIEESECIGLTIGNQQQQKTAPVFYNDGFPESQQEPNFPSLTAMMIRLVEVISQSG